MVEKFLNAKHWQIFVFLFAVPMGIHFIMMIVLLVDVFSPSHTDTTGVFAHLRLFPLLAILYIGLYLSWFWSVAIGLQSKVPDAVHLKTTVFKLLFSYSIIFFASVMFAAFYLFNNILLSDIAPNFEFVEEFLAVGIPLFVLLYFFAVFCMFYMVYFVAKTLKTAMLQREVKFGDFVGEFFLLWAFPVGIWFIQPKINKLVEDE